MKAFYREEAEVEQQVKDLLDIFDLGRFSDTLCGSMSYGDQRRLEIVRALATKPELLLLDEPAAGMNPREKEELMELIKFVKGKFEIAVLLVEHDMKVVMGICQRVDRARLRCQNRRGHARRSAGQSKSHRSVSRRGSAESVAIVMLEIRDLAVSYGSITALHDVCLHVGKGDIVTLIGANGAGKSTTLRTISGLLKAQSGQHQIRRRGNQQSTAAQDCGARHFPRPGRKDDFCQPDRAARIS